MPIPDLSNLQFFILGHLLNGTRTGRDLRAALAKEKHKKSRAAFYQMMSRMEENKLVNGWYEPKKIDGHIVQERHYEATGTGVTTWERTRDFLIEAALLGGRGMEGYAT